MYDSTSVRDQVSSGCQVRPTPARRMVRGSCRHTGIRARVELSSRLIPTAEITSPLGNRLRIARARTALLSSAVQNLVSGKQAQLVARHRGLAVRAPLAESGH